MPGRSPINYHTVPAPSRRLDVRAPLRRAPAITPNRRCILHNRALEIFATCGRPARPPDQGHANGGYGRNPPIRSIPERQVLPRDGVLHTVVPRRTTSGKDVPRSQSYIAHPSHSPSKVIASLNRGGGFPERDPDMTMRRKQKETPRGGGSEDPRIREGPEGEAGPPPS